MKPDGDGDGKCNEIDPCTNLGPIDITRAKIIVRKLLTPAGDDRLRFKGQMVLPTPFNPSLDPISRGARVVISPTAETGQCGEAAFPGPGPQNPSRVLKAPGDKVLCK